jgi:hypothetical protein
MPLQVSCQLLLSFCDMGLLVVSNHDCVDPHSALDPSECDALDDAAAQDHEHDQHRQRGDHGSRHELTVVGAEFELEDGETNFHVEEQLIVRDQQRPDEGGPRLNEGEDTDRAEGGDRERSDYTDQYPPL